MENKQHNRHQRTVTASLSLKKANPFPHIYFLNETAANAGKVHVLFIVHPRVHVEDQLA